MVFGASPEKRYMAGKTNLQNKPQTLLIDLDIITEGFYPRAMA
jgi:hypothetical protein